MTTATQSSDRAPTSPCLTKYIIHPHRAIITHTKGSITAGSAEIITANALPNQYLAKILIYQVHFYLKFTLGNPLRVMLYHQIFSVLYVVINAAKFL